MSAWLEATFTTCRPRALAALTRIFRDIDIAEEAFSEACLKALTDWPENGTPRDPFAWLLTTARNSALDDVRKTNRRKQLLNSNMPAIEIEEHDINSSELPDPYELRDDVLRLLFICCHPTLSRQDQIALALRIVAGLTVAEIARGFLVKPKAMEQRLTRARKTAAQNPVAFKTPSLQERGRRLGEVSLMVYLMFNEGWSTSDSSEQIRLTLCEEAIRLARLLLDLFPGMGEQAALLSLLLFQHARRDARINKDGKLVALNVQDRALWDSQAIAEAVALLQKSERIGHQGVYRIQAAIAAEHALASSTKTTDWRKIEAHYEALYNLQPSPVVRLNLIAAQAKTHGPQFALDKMNDLTSALQNYRWFHTMRAGLLEEISDFADAHAAYKTALTLGPTQPEREIILGKMAECEKNLTQL